MKLELTALKKAVTSLKMALDEFKKTENAFVKDACIQRFEYTYDLSHKMLKRQLEAMSATAEAIDTMSFQELIRQGAETGLLLSSWDIWKKYRHARNTTSHAYDEDKANAVFADIPGFYQEVTYLLKQLEKHNEQ